MSGQCDARFMGADGTIVFCQKEPGHDQFEKDAHWGEVAWVTSVWGSRGTTLNVPTGTPSASTPSQPVGWNEPIRPPDSLGNSPVPERFRSVSGPRPAEGTTA